MSKEVMVVLKDSERSYRQKFLMYEDIALSPDEPLLRNCIEEAKKNFMGEPEDIQLKISMVIR